MQSDSNADMAWKSGDLPGELHFPHHIPANIYAHVKNILSDVFEPAKYAHLQIHSLTPTKEITGRYKIQTATGSWFVKISPRKGSPLLEKQIIDYLYDKGVPTNPILLSGHKFTYNHRIYYLTIQNLLQGRHFNGSEADLFNLGQTLSKCHQALSYFPMKTQIMNLSRNHMESISALKTIVERAIHSKQFEMFKEYGSWVEQNTSWVATAVENWPIPFPNRTDNQCLHGEIHQGNVIYNLTDGKAILVDFEESRHIFSNVNWDVAFAIQRFCMRDDPQKDILLDRIATFTKGYGRKVPNLSQTMRDISWYTFARILDLRINHFIISPVSELDKFVRLERQANNTRTFI